MEEWKSIPGYEGLYEVSSYGRVRSVDRYDNRNCFRKGKVLSPGIRLDGYLIINLCCNGKYKTISVHRLVALTFLPNPDNLPCVNHKDEDKTNNRVDNLEWCTQQYNLNYNDVQKRRSQRMKENGIYEKIALKRRKHSDTVGLDKREYRNHYMREYREEHREHYREYQREYRKRKRGQ